MDDTKADIALNSTDCIRSASHFGWDEVVNICSGARTIIDWGGADWVGFVMLVSFGALVLAALALMVTFLAKEQW